MTPRENYIKAVRFQGPDHIPVSFHINPACWHHYDQNALQDLMEAHPFLFPNFQRQDVVTPHYELYQRAETPYTDSWGCRWETSDNGITGAVLGHSLPDWNDFPSFTPPDPKTTDGVVPIDWESIEKFNAEKRERGKLVVGGLPHGHTFLRVQDIRGYENLMFDMIDEEPRLWELLEMIEAFNADLIRRWLGMNPDMISYPEDLGMQIGPMLSPDHFRKYIKPSYQRLMKPARDADCIVHMHSDGDIRTLADDLIDGGVEVINLQDLVNGIDWIAEKFAGKTCIDLDVDRQNITARGTPKQIDTLICEEVEKLSTPAGGLLLTFGLYPGTPLKNAAAVMDALERYAHYH